MPQGNQRSSGAIGNYHCEKHANQQSSSGKSKKFHKWHITRTIGNLSSLSIECLSIKFHLAKQTFTGLTETIGLVAAIFTTMAYLPQFVKVWKTHSTRDISLRMYLMMCTGVFLWLVYGIRLHALPIILANGVTLVLTLAILWFKIKHK
jgi:MtN3 and saliva related transmembrane protein